MLSDAFSTGVRKILRFPVRLAIKLAAWSAMAMFLSSPGQTLWRQRLATRPGDAAGLSCALVVHVYYIDMLDEVLACWRNFPEGAPLHITTPLDKADALRAALTKHLSPDEASRVVVHPNINRGRDIAPFLALLSSGALDGFDAVLKLHTKRSPHLMDGGLRRRLLFTMLAGCPDQVRVVLGLFADRGVGMAGFGRSFRHRAAFWMSNRARVEALCARMPVDCKPVLGFFEGSMFWVRPASLQHLRDLRVQTDDFEVEAGQLDGAFHHAIERMFTIAVWGYHHQVTDLRGRTLKPGV